MNTKLFLILSFVLSVAFALFLLRANNQPPHTAKTVTPHAEAAFGLAPTEKSDSSAGNIRRATDSSSPSWANVASEDHQVYIANLRALGCPEETIRDIIIGDINRLYNKKMMQEVQTTQKFEYWKPTNPFQNPFLDKERMQRMAALESEKQVMLQELGIDLTQPALSSGLDPMATMFDFLPESKRASLKKAMANAQSSYQKYADELTVNPAAAMAKIQRETEETIQAVLTTEEYLDYQLRFSQTALNLRMNLSGFDPSEDEFLAIYKLRSEFDREYQLAVLENPNEAAASDYSEAQKQGNEEIRATRGDERYAEYVRAQDQSFQQLWAITQQAGLPTTVADEVYELKKATDAQIAEIHQNQDLTAKECPAAVQSIGLEAERSAQQILGEDAWKRYDLGNNLTWLRVLSEQPAATSPTLTIIK